MNKTIKKIIVIFTALCALFLIVFTIELILLNRDSGGGEAEPSLSGSTPSEDGATSAGSGSSGENPSGTADSNGEPPPSDGPPPAPRGDRHERLMPNDMDLVFYVDTALFEHTATETEDIIDVFSLRGEGPAGLEIRFVFMPQGVSAYAGSFLEVDFDAAESTVHGEEPIRRSALRGVSVSGTKNGTTYEAWIYMFSDPDLSNLGVAFITNFQNETQRNAIYAILDSLDMAQ